MIDCIGIKHVKELMHTLNHKVCYFWLLNDLRKSFPKFWFRVWSKTPQVIGKKMRLIRNLEKQYDILLDEIFRILQHGMNFKKVKKSDLSFKSLRCSWRLYWFFSKSLDMTVRCELVQYRLIRRLSSISIKTDFFLGDKQWGMENLEFYVGLDCSN